MPTMQQGVPGALDIASPCEEVSHTARENLRPHLPLGESWVPTYAHMLVHSGISYRSSTQKSTLSERGRGQVRRCCLRWKIGMV